MASTSTPATSRNQNQPIVFSTQTPYPLPTQKYMIPTSWKRYHLSQLINKALELAKPVPFDFLVRGEVLRGTLAEWCAEHEVGEEETLEVEYIESVMPPQKMSEFPHEDWVSSVSCQLSSHFLTASYDGRLRAFDLSRNLSLNVWLHPAAITSISLLPMVRSINDSTHMNTDDDDDEGIKYTIASSSQDLTARLSQVIIPSLAQAPSSKIAKSKAKSTILASLHLHTSPLSCVASNSKGSHLLTSSWDGLVGVWDTSIPNVDEVPESLASNSSSGDRKKRRKIQNDEGHDEGVDNSKPVRKAPIGVLKSHTGRVSQVVWDGDEGAVSCGFDSTVRTWDVENGVCTRTITSSEKPYLSLTLSSSSGQSNSQGKMVLATSTDRTMTLYDLRTTELSAAVASFLHPAMPSCISVPHGSSLSSTSPPSLAQGQNQNQNASQNQVITGAYDGIVRIWDLRSTKGAMATFKTWDGQKKVLSVDWNSERGLVGIGGEGGLEVWKL